MGGLTIIFRFMTNYVVKNPLNALLFAYNLGQGIYDRITKREK